MGMANGNHKGELGDVYAAKSSPDIVEIYDRWLATCDDYIETISCRHSAICVCGLGR